MGNNPEALKYLKRTLETHTSLNDWVGMARDYATIGLVLFDIDSDQEALDFHNRALEIDKVRDDKVGLATDYANIGVVPKELGKNIDTMDSIIKGLNIFLKLEAETGYHHPLIDTLDGIKEGLERQRNIITIKEGIR